MKLDEVKQPKASRSGLNTALKSFYELQGWDPSTIRITTESYYEENPKYPTPKGQPWKDPIRVPHWFFSIPDKSKRPLLTKYLQGLGFRCDLGYSKGTAQMEASVAPT